MTAKLGHLSKKVASTVANLPGFADAPPNAFTKMAMAPVLKFILAGDPISSPVSLGIPDATSKLDVEPFMLDDLFWAQEACRVGVLQGPNAFLLLARECAAEVFQLEWFLQNSAERSRCQATPLSCSWQVSALECLGAFFLHAPSIWPCHPL